MKKLYRRLAVTFAVSAVLSMLIFAVSLYFRGISENGRYLDQLLLNVEMNLEYAREYNGENMSGKELTAMILKQATTDYGTSIFAISRETGEIFGKTENNSPLLVIDGAEEGPELLRHITELPKDRGIILRINGKFQSVVIRELDGVYLMAFSGLGRVAGDVFLTFFLDLIVVGVICGLTLLLVRQHLKNYEIQLIKARTERPYWTSWRR